MPVSLRLSLWLVVSWCVMVTTHECGHLIGGWISGAHLLHAELRPWRLPHSHFGPDPRPLVTLWAGPLLGVLVPAGLSRVIQRQWASFLEGFCWLANGAYLATGWWAGDRFLDTQRLLDAGASRASIAVYCVVTIGVGYPLFRKQCMALFAQERFRDSVPTTPPSA